MAFDRQLFLLAARIAGNLFQFDAENAAHHALVEIGCRTDGGQAEIDPGAFGKSGEIIAADTFADVADAEIAVDGANPGEITEIDLDLFAG